MAIVKQIKDTAGTTHDIYSAYADEAGNACLLYDSEAQDLYNADDFLHIDGSNNITGTTNLVRDNGSVDTMFYTERTDSGEKIGFGIGTSNNRGIYDSKAGGWVLKIDPNNNVTLSGKAAGASKADALAVSSAVGSTTQPVYIDASGKPQKISYTIAKSVPSNAAFTDTNTHYTSKNVVTNSSTGTSNSSVAADGTESLYLNHVEMNGSTAVSVDSIKIQVDGNNACVYSNGNGDITFEIADSDYDQKTSSSNKTGTKLLLVGATTATTTGQTTYTNSNCYVGTDNCLYSNGSKVLTAGDGNNKVYNTTTTSTYYLCGSTVSTSTTSSLVKRSTVYVNTSGNLVAPTFVGNLSGTASSAYTAEAAGTAEEATCLADKSKGSTNLPVYINASGRPVACSYTLSKSVPNNAIFTDANVTNNITKSTYYLCGSTVSSNTTGNLVKRSNVYVNANAYLYAAAFYETSDERLKDFSNKIDVDLDKISKIKKHRFTWKGSENKKEEIGVSAQEIRELYPEIVSENEEGHLSVSYEKLAVVALAAIDELHKKNKELEARIELLESKLLN